MRETVTSNCEKAFIQKLITSGLRLDGRKFHQSRDLSLKFGSEWGCCLVNLGETKVLSQVTCEIVQPKMIRPNEGVLFVNVELGPIASPNFEANRQSGILVHLNRMLEKCLKDSKCIDLESLCIVVEEKVWSLRVDVRVLNHGGNLIEACSVAALASLAHFKRPDVTRVGENVIVHTVVEKDPIPTVLYHYPVCVGFAIFGDEMIQDPSETEENVCMSLAEDGQSTAGSVLIVGMNQYRELCLLNLQGAAIQNQNIIHRAMIQAANRAKIYVDTIKQSIIDDDNLRKKRVDINLGSIITTEHKMSLARKDLKICLPSYRFESSDVNMSEAGSGDESDKTFELDDADEAKDDEPVEELSKYNKVGKKSVTKNEWLEVSSDSE